MRKSILGELDEPRATLRLLLRLYEIGRSINQNEIHKIMYEKEKLGQKTIDTAIRTLNNIGLLEIERKGKNPRGPIIHHLTSSGEKIAIMVLELKKELEQKTSKPSIFQRRFKVTRPASKKQK